MASPKTKVFDCYATLGVSPYADTETIQQAYDQLALVHREWGDNSAEATASLQKLKNACETLTDVPRRWSYDFDVKQEYLRTHRKMIELDEEIGKQRDSKPHGVVAADPNVRANHETMARLAQTMAGFVRELKFLPGERDRHDDCRKREQGLIRRIGQLEWQFDSLCETHKSLQDYLRSKVNNYRTLRRLLEQEKEKVRDAEASARVVRWLEDVRTPAALRATDQSTKPAEGNKGNKTGPTISDLHGGESPEVKDEDEEMSLGESPEVKDEDEEMSLGESPEVKDEDEDEEMSLVWQARQGGALPF